MTTSASTGSVDPIWRLRWWLFASGVATLAALAFAQLIVLRDMPSYDWQWQLFAWGIVVGLFGAVCVNAFFGFMTRIRAPEAGKRVWMRRRRLVYTWVWLFVGVEIGMLAAMFGVAWLIIATAGYIVFVFGFVGIFVARKHRQG